MLAQQLFYLQCIYLSDEEKYKPAILLTFFKFTFSVFSVFFCCFTNKYNEMEQKIAIIINFTKYIPFILNHQ